MNEPKMIVVRGKPAPQGSKVSFRNGYMKEALKLLIPSLFIDLRLNRIEAATLEENIASKSLLKKKK